ncbi:thioesterase family protein [Alteromonas sp. A079]|uniref:thioesterase family protein n=1 Tax=Alteromonas sp. A079 TaxID=3410268 RepID=UPI003BA373CC
MTDQNSTHNDEENPLTHAALTAFVIGLFNDTMPFNNLLGLDVVDGENGIELHVGWKQELTGNPLKGILHGGVTATMLDTIGGLVAITETIKHTDASQLSELKVRLPTMGTVDMRVDYLRPGRGARFVATATVIRKGSKLVVCRMELHNEKGDHIAFGTGTYMLG